MEDTKGQLTTTAFDIIKQSDILTGDDFAVLEPLMPELKDTFVKSQVFRTRTEMEVSVLNDIKFPTPASKYWQAVREQNVMFTELVMLSYEYRKNMVELKKLVRKSAEEKDDLELELLTIEMEKLMFILRNQERTAKDRIREVKAWSEIKEREGKKMPEDETKNVDTHQLKSYTRQWIKQAIVMGDGGSPDERNNLLGQLSSGLAECQKQGVLEEVLKDFDIKKLALIGISYGSNLD